MSRKTPEAWMRPMLSGDLERVLEWRNHPQTRAVMYTSHEITLAEHAAWFERVQNDERTHLLIFMCDDTPSGYVKFQSLTQHGEKGTADWGFYLAPEAPPGSGKLLGITALDHAFDKLGFKTIEAEVIENNEKSLRFHKRLGFRETGTGSVDTAEGSVAIRSFKLERGAWLAHRKKLD